MRFFKELLFIGVLPTSFAFSEPLPSLFEKAPLINLPISTGKSSYQGTIVSSSKYIDRKLGEVAANEEFYDAMATLQKYLLSDKRRDLFSLNNNQWSQDKKSTELANDWRVSRLPCLAELKCFVFGLRGGASLIIEKNSEVTDFQLVDAVQYKLDDKGNTVDQAAELDTVFGDMGLLPFPETHYGTTGIFCSIYTYTAGEGRTQEYKVFKSRITPDGKIENKEVTDGSKTCKDPW